MRTYLILLLQFFVGALFAQTDTIVVRDYTKIFITIDNTGEINPVTNYSEVRKVGFFLNEIPEGTLRICNENELYAWVDGRLVFSVKDCGYFDPTDLFQYSESDSVFVAMSAPLGFENFKCELLVFDDLIVLREEVSNPRQVHKPFHEFSILAFISLLAVFAFYATTFPNRLNFFISKTFTLKASAYQFINTGFFDRANILMMLMISLTAAFEVIYINQKVDLMIFSLPVSVTEYVILWLSITIWIALFFLVKRVLVQIIAGMFQIKKLRDWQLFDLVNFAGNFSLVLFIIILWDFVLKDSNESWVISYFSYYFIAVLLLFELWFIIKFVINSSYQKLLIISYLCATELIPSIFIMVWFFK